MGRLWAKQCKKRKANAFRFDIRSVPLYPASAACPPSAQKCKKIVPSTRRARNCSFGDPGDLGWLSDETLRWGRKAPRTQAPQRANRVSRCPLRLVVKFTSYVGFRHLSSTLYPAAARARVRVNVIFQTQAKAPKSTFYIGNLSLLFINVILIINLNVQRRIRRTPPPRAVNVKPRFKDKHLEFRQFGLNERMFVCSLN